MSSSAVRTFGIVLVLAAAVSAVVLARGADDAAPAVDALRPGDAPGAAAAAPVIARPAPPPRPRRQIVPDVEVVVNIPSGRLLLISGDSVVRSYPVSVGSARYATPVGEHLLATVIWNPWWRPPPGSAWAKDRKPEPPGPRNPMGRVKLHMDDLIFIHGTTSEGRLGAPASHGCIRMSNTDVVDLARRLTRIADPDVGEAELDAVSAAGKRERHTVMARSIRMRVSYRVAEVRGERLHVYPDVYGRAGALTPHVRRALAASGVDTAEIPAPAMARLRQGAARGGASFPLTGIASLQPLPPEPPRETGPRLLGVPASEVRGAEPPTVDSTAIPTAETTETP